MPVWGTATNNTTNHNKALSPQGGIQMTDPAPAAKKNSRWWLFVAVAVAAAIVTFAATAMVTSIFDHKQEVQLTTYKRVEPIDDTTYDPAVWGKTYTAQYDLYKQTSEFFGTTFAPALVAADKNRTAAGAPDKADGTPFIEDGTPLPDERDMITASKIEDDTRLITMWKGYAFSIDYRHLRGHEYMLIDQQMTRRTMERPQFGACLNCHTSLPQVLDELGNGDREAGWAAMNMMPYGEVVANDVAKAPIGCIDCHDPATMKLRLTRPGAINGIKAWKASEGIANYDPNKDATTDEMRSFVCAQCHVEYYMKGDEKTLTFPWAEGLDINDMYAYYTETRDEGTFEKDFEHKLTGAPILKAQHPEFETWSMSVHGINNVSCADCHMSYVREGGQKVSNHNVKSPMVDLAGTCGTCHPGSTDVLEERILTIQNRFVDSRDRTLDALVALIDDIAAGIESGLDEDRLNQAREYQRLASFYIDFAYSENSYGFHAPDYMQRILSQSLDASRMGQLVLLGVDPESLAPSEISNANVTAGMNRGGTF